MSKAEKAVSADTAINTNEKKPFNFGVISFTLSFPNYPTFGFEFNRKLTEEIKLLRQNFYGLKQSERVAAEPQYRLEFLAGSLRSRPTGLEVFDYPDTGNIQNDFKTFFSQAEFEELLDYVWTMNQDHLYPKELLSTPSE